MRSDQNNRRSGVPKGLEVGAKVEILGERGVYLVVRVDEQRYVADLMLMGRIARLEHGVSFGNIRPVAETRTGGFSRSWLPQLDDAASTPADD